MGGAVLPRLYADCPRHARRLAHDRIIRCMNISLALFLASSFALFDPNRDRHTEAGHAVQNVAAYFRSLR